MEAEAFGSAVLEAFQAATGERLAEWTRTQQALGLQAEVDNLRTVPTPVSGEIPLAFRRSAGQPPPRPLGDLAEDLISAFDEVGRAPAPKPATGTGSAAGGKVTLTLSPSALVSCTADPAWVSRQTATMLTNALLEALAAARASLREAAPAPESPLNDLLSEVFAILGDPGRLRP
ncbi:hypothetical protein [Actinokineospora spheciospongiae]|uniref:hypothetical protein n=1 Tax=Actinokineospora spheciospongiae TaxID=909613 RepID=UPI0011B4E535|nr:hypothetical protein [Actinokineospora spheciospongiae]